MSHATRECVRVHPGRHTAGLQSASEIYFLLPADDHRAPDAEKAARLQELEKTVWGCIQDVKRLADKLFDLGEDSADENCVLNKNVMQWSPALRYGSHRKSIRTPTY